MTTTTINSQDTMFTVDQYQTFNLDAETEYLIQDYNDNNNTNYSYDDFNIEYDMDGYLKELSDCSIDFINELFKDDSIVKSVRLLEYSSPKFYNYSTDSYSAEWKYNSKKLKLFIDNKWDDFCKFLADEWRSVYSNLNNDKKIIKNYKFESLPYYKDDDCLAAMLDYYARLAYLKYVSNSNSDISEFSHDDFFSDETYLSHMFETAQGYEYINIKETIQ